MKDKMKTPLQELIEHFTDAWSSTSDLWKPSKVIAKIETMLEQEKKVIINAANRCEWLMVKCRKLVASSSLKLDAIWGSIPHASANGREMVRNSEMNFRMSLVFYAGSNPATSTKIK